jgi:hypothetical protein
MEMAARSVKRRGGNVVSAIEDFLGRFEEEGRYREGSGFLPVTFLTNKGSRFAGKFSFQDGLCIRAEMDGYSQWGYPDNSPLSDVQFSLVLDPETILTVQIDQGRITHHYVPEVKTSKQDFLTNFRLARNLFAHPRVDTDNAALDKDSIKRMVVRAALWLTPKSVAGFNAAHFLELGAARQLELQRLVSEFREIATSVPPNKPATGDQYDRARLIFMELMEILDPYLFSPQEGKQVEEALKKVAFPPWALNWDYELGSDPDGTPSVLVTIFVDDESLPRRELGRFASSMTNKIRTALNEVGSQRWPNIIVRTGVEHKAG